MNIGITLLNTMNPSRSKVSYQMIDHHNGSSRKMLMKYQSNGMTFANKVRSYRATLDLSGFNQNGAE